MKYLDFFFPYNTLFLSFEESLAIWWVISLIVYCLLSFLFLQWWPKKIGVVNRSLRKTISVLDSDQPINTTIESNKFLNMRWKRYRHTFLSEGESAKTIVDATTFFNFDSVVSRLLNLRYWRSVPAVLVGMGILGTFVGLVVGINEFQTESVEQIENSIKTLLAGMQAAFLTSIWGMLLSIVFGVGEKWQFNKTEKHLQTLTTRLNEKYHLSSVSDFVFYRDEEGRLVYPAVVLRDLRHNSEEQTKALKSFSSDLADGIQISTQTIELMAKQISNAVQQSISNALEPAIKSLNESVTQLREERNEATGEYIQDITKQLSDQFKQMGENLHDALSGTAITQMEKLSESLNQSSNQMSELPNRIHEMIDGMKSTAEENKHLLKETAKTIKESLEQQVQSTETHYGNILKDMSKSYEDIKGQFEKLVGDIKQGATDAVSQMRDDTETASHRLSETLHKFYKIYEDIANREQETGVLNRGLLEKAGTLIEAFTETTSDLESTLGGITESLQHVGRDIVSGIQGIQECSQNLRSTTQTFREYNDQFLTNNREILMQIRESLDKSKELANDYASKFETIEEGLIGIFDEIEKGLTRYQEKTKEGLNQSLADFSNQFQDGVNTLGAVVTDLADILEDLHQD